MYAPFRLPPLDRTDVLIFEKDLSLMDGDLEDLAPSLILLRLEGKREKTHEERVSAYVFHFLGKFAVGEARDHLQFFISTFGGEELVILPKTYTFSTPCYVEGNRAYAEETSPETLLPETTFSFLDLTYTLISLECIREDIFDALYRVEK